MAPVERVVALCEGGPFDGQAFSVALKEQGVPDDIHQAIVEPGGVLVEHVYVPDEEIPAHDAVLGLLGGNSYFAGHTLTGVWKFRPARGG